MTWFRTDWYVLKCHIGRVRISNRTISDYDESPDFRLIRSKSLIDMSPDLQFDGSYCFRIDRSSFRIVKSRFQTDTTRSRIDEFGFRIYMIRFRERICPDFEPANPDFGLKRVPKFVYPNLRLKCPDFEFTGLQFQIDMYRFRIETFRFKMDCPDSQLIGRDFAFEPPAFRLIVPITNW